MTDAELRDELVTLLLAGHETTAATAVAWAVERLVRHPDKLARLVAEIDAEEGDEYMQAVVTETLRTLRRPAGDPRAPPSRCRSATDSSPPAPA